MQDQANPSPSAPPDLCIPASLSTVEVRVIDTNTLIHLNPKMFWQPHIANFTGVHAPDYCFLVSNGERHVLFDLGVRPDWHNYAPRVVSSIDAATTITVGTDVSSMLDSDKSALGIRSKDIEAVIWSHNHFDHIGDMSRFPGTTRLVVGPGVRAVSWPGYPSNPDSLVLDADAEGRVVQELSFQSHGPQRATPFRIGRFDAFDYFSDGSFYLLNAPGHAVGHLCGLARTTSEPGRDGRISSSFVFMGADACHHPGVLRPSVYLPIPTIDALNGMVHVNTVDKRGVAPCVCPGELLHEHMESKDQPFFTVARGPLFVDYDSAMDTVGKIQELDAAENVFVVMAHDLSIRDRIAFFPRTINDWMSSGVKGETRWLFCEDIVRALAHNSAARAQVL